MALSNALLRAQVTHARHSPKPHAFRYGVYYLCFGLSDLPRLANRLLSLDRFNLFSFYERDHGAKDGSSNEAWIRGILREWDIPHADGQIVLQTLPRILGYVFNPVSFWFCLDESGRLRAVLSEVCNTFGERHCYISFHDDRRPIHQDDRLTSQKLFHVSPFMDVRGHYQFRFAYREDATGVWIDYYDNGTLMLATSVTGRREPLTTRRLLYYFFRYPLVTFKVIGLIHFEALRLLLKGMRYRAKPIPPTSEVTR